MKTMRPRRRRRPQRGASAIVFALVFMVIMAAGAVGFDISKLVYERQQVRAAVDAAAQIGAARLDSSGLTTSQAGSLVTLIKNAAVSNYGGSSYGPGLVAGNVTVDFFCVVANTSQSAAIVSPDTTQIPTTCKPDPNSTNYTSGTKCSATSCAIPCDPVHVTGAVCNSVRVSATKQVQFLFAPAINIDHGQAAASTISCQGTCGGDAPPNPMDVVVMADRTPSMSSTQLAAMKTGLEGMLAAMNPKQQYVAFGALGISGTSSATASGSTKIKAASATNVFTNPDYATYPPNVKGVPQPTTWSSQNKLWRFNGTWVPINYSDKYQTTNSSGVRVMNTSSELGDAVSSLSASSVAKTYPSPWHIDSNDNPVTSSTKRNLAASDKYGQAISGHGNTHLASALKAAARYVINTNPATLNLPDRSVYGVPKKVIIFETDGAPREVFNSSSTALSLDNDYDIGATNDDHPDATAQTACDNFSAVAQSIKQQTPKVLLIMIAVGDAAQSATTCGNQSVAKMMAAAASDRDDGTPSDAAASCDSAANRAAENADKDNFYCASDANELKLVFKAAMGNITGGTRFMGIDGVGD